MLNLKQQFFKQVEKASFPLIVFSSDWRGEAIASSLALFLLLKKMGKNVSLVADTSAKKNLWSFLPGSTNINHSLDDLHQFVLSLEVGEAKINKIKYALEDKKLNFIISTDNGQLTDKELSISQSNFKYDLIISVGASDLDSLGNIYDNNVEFFYKTTLINIDHLSENEEFGQINITDITATSSAEIIFNLFNTDHLELIDEDVATCLLAGIISGTKNFRKTNLTPQTLMITSSLISLGGRREEVVDKLYNSREFKTLKLWGKILANLKSSLNNSLIWSYLRKEDLEGNATPEDHLLDITEELIVNIPEAKLIVFMFEDKKENTNKLILYSVKNINALEIISDYHPRGNKKIAEAQINGKIEEALLACVKKLEQEIKDVL